MATPKLLSRLEIVEAKVSALEELPARIDALGVQIREQGQALDRAVSALRSEIAACRGELRSEIAACRDELRSEIAGCRDELRSEIAAYRDELRAEVAATHVLMRTLNDETRTHMLVLHEAVLERIKWLGEVRPAAAPSGTDTGDAGPRGVKRKPTRRRRH